ncbi:MAG: ferrous iron transport protein A [Bryobacteraceae bacterium]|nr:ferrous iron transport protein A [Bryobacteraceae bacterium]MDW8380302.1 FeoA family protein [Bryobacterales bacterium]
MQLSVDKRRWVTLADLLEGQQGVLDCLELPEDLARRLMELGFVPGHVVAAAKSAPGGDPRVFRVDGSEVALRRETARCLRVRLAE